MIEYTQSQIWTLVGLNEHNETSNSEYYSISANNVLLPHQGTGPLNAAEAQGLGQQLQVIP
ncbi:unnamed protein product [Penicillium camemberti]|uniref:Str. FM013 n=1 Tax=Penicillium camemberti (strain FM 013) TaxID=1429867 RepID=A0A0G4PWX3_PENC3|nr:unnamed protein product [Penicillium camemberti]